jgi:hypothetical protein
VDLLGLLCLVLLIILSDLYLFTHSPIRHHQLYWSCLPGPLGRLPGAAGVGRRETVQHPQGLWRRAHPALGAHLLQPAGPAGVPLGGGAAGEAADRHSRGLGGVRLRVRLPNLPARRWKHTGNWWKMVGVSIREQPCVYDFVKIKIWS